MLIIIQVGKLVVQQMSSWEVVPIDICDNKVVPLININVPNALRIVRHDI